MPNDSIDPVPLWGVSFDMDYRERITIEPGKRGGKPCIRGLRITVYDVLEYLAAGMTPEQILADFRQMSFLFGAPPKVVWIRLGNCSTEEILSSRQPTSSLMRTLCEAAKNGGLGRFSRRSSSRRPPVTRVSTRITSAAPSVVCTHSPT